MKIRLLAAYYIISEVLFTMIFSITGKYSKRYKSSSEQLDAYLTAHVNQPIPDISAEDIKQHQRYKLHYFVSGDVDFTDDQPKITARDTISLNLNNIKKELSDNKALKEELRKFLGYYRFYVFSTFNDQRFGRRAWVIIPLKTPVKDAELYNQAITMLKSFCVGQGIISKVDRIRNAFTQPDPCPMQKQNAKPVVINDKTNYFDLNNPDIQRQIHFDAAKSVAPKDAAKVELAFSKDNRSAHDVIADFVQSHGEWLYELKNYIACELALKRAENRNEIDHAEALDAVKLLAGANVDWIESNVAHYENLSLPDVTYARGRGMSYFITESNLGTDLDWVEANDNGRTSIDYAKIAKRLIKQYHFIRSDNLRESKSAIYDDDRWYFLDADQRMQHIINQTLDNAAPLVKWSDRAAKALWNRVRADALAPEANADPFDHPSPYLIQFENGTLDLQHQQFSRHRAEDYLAHVVPYDYPSDDDYIEPAKVLDWITYLFDGDKQAMQFFCAFLGMAFTQSYDRQYWITLIGDGSNGKTTLINYIKKLFEPNDVASISLSKLGGKNNRFVLSSLYRRHLAISAENSDAYLHASDAIKTLTGNESTNDIEFKGRTAFSAKLYAGLIAATNDLPTLKDHSDGMQRRLAVIKMSHNFENKSELQYVEQNFKMTDLEALIPDFTRYCLQLFYISVLAPAQQRRNYMQRSDRMLETAQQWDEQNDTVRTFFEDFCVMSDNPHHAETVNDLYSIYQQSANASGNGVLSKNRFIADLLRVTKQSDSAYHRFRSVNSGPARRIEHVCFNKETIEMIKDNVTSHDPHAIRLYNYSHTSVRFLAGEAE